MEKQIVFGLTRVGLEPTIYHTQGANHYATDAAALKNIRPGFVCYKKDALDSQAQVIKSTSCLHMVDCSLRVLFHH